MIGQGRYVLAEKLCEVCHLPRGRTELALPSPSPRPSRNSLPSCAAFAGCCWMMVKGTVRWCPTRRWLVAVKISI